MCNNMVDMENLAAIRKFVVDGEGAERSRETTADETETALFKIHKVNILSQAFLEITLYLPIIIVSPAS